MSRSKKRKRGQRRTSHRSLHGRRAIPTRPKANLRRAIVLSAVLFVLLGFTAFGILESIRIHGHVHLNMLMLILDGVAGLYTVLEWSSWHKYH